MLETTRNVSSSGLQRDLEEEEEEEEEEEACYGISKSSPLLVTESIVASYVSSNYKRKRNPSHGIEDCYYSDDERCSSEIPDEAASSDTGESLSSPVPAILKSIVSHIQDELAKRLQNDSIDLCGKAPLAIIQTKPDEVLDLAHKKLHAWPYREVPVCWRRLYEEATLHKAVKMLRQRTSIIDQRLPPASEEAMNRHGDWFAGLVEVLDMGLSLSGAPGRKQLFEDMFARLQPIVPKIDFQSYPQSFVMIPPPSLTTKHAITKATKPLSFIAFQDHLDTTTSPLIIPDLLTAWPALKKWQSPLHLLNHTLNGHRLVPIELGTSYVETSWTQKLLPMHDFLTTYLLSSRPPEKAYLAQHDLFAQIPSLRSEIQVPDYCFTTPPEADESAAKTAGLDSVSSLESPLLNAWLGPQGTKTPLHTDPYHNLLAQVVGFKYVRLYPPTETGRLYPRGVDEKGISLENTSLVDLRGLRPRLEGSSGEAEISDGVVIGEDGERQGEEDIYARFPLLRDARYVEGILGPGETLYIPLGWWHYVESLSISFSVSFWWN